MKLETSNGVEILNPSAAQIAEAIASLPGGDESFVILSTAAQSYIQAAGSSSEGFAVEYRDGSEHAHYEAVGAPLDPQLTTSIFQRYAAGDSSWRGLTTWQPPSAIQLSGLPPLTWALFAVGMIVLIVGLYWVAAT